MKQMSHRRGRKLLCLLLAAVLLVAALPTAGLTASAAGSKGAYFIDGNPPFAYVITGVKAEDDSNTVKLYQDANMQSYENYTGEYSIPERVYSEEDWTFYTVTEIGGAMGSSVPGALQNVPLRGVSIPRTVTTVGTKAFAGCKNLSKVTFPTSVTSLASDAFSGVLLQKLTLSVVTETALSGDTAYTTAERQAPIMLPRRITDLEVSAPLSVSGQFTIPGSAVISSGGITIESDASLTLRGALSGRGAIEIGSGAAFILEGTAAAYTGSIYLTAAKSQFTNSSSAPVTVVDASGKSVSVQPGETRLGEQKNDPAPIVTPPPTPADTDPQISTNYGGSVAVEDNGRVIVISVLDGYRVEDVVINGLSMGSITRYEFETASKENTVQVIFARGNADVDPQPPKPADFLDVPTDASYADAVRFLVENGLLQGVSNTRFAPEQRTTRAMFVTMLRRMEVYAPRFKVKYAPPVYPLDTPEGAWYTDSTAWAVGTGVFEIDVSNTFRPNQLITREEAALCLYRYTHKRGYDTYLDVSRYRAYRDSSMIVPGARKAMVWAATEGYLRTENRMLDPAGYFTRAEMAEMLALYLKKN